MNRTVVIGDIHGCYDEFIELINKVGLQDSDLLISVGDIADRGGKSKELYHYFKNRPNAIVLMGNHERKHLNGVLSYAQEIVKVQMGSEYPAFIEWLKTLPYYYETSEAIIVHAAMEHDKPVQQQKEEVLSGATAGERHLEKIYGSEKYWSDLYNGAKAVIYGHHVVGDFPLIKNNTYGLDTGACHGGNLTALELPGFIIHQVKVHTDYWKEEQIKWQIPVLQAKDWDNMDITDIKKFISKLRYVENTDVQLYLTRLEARITELENSLNTIKDKLDAFTHSLYEKHPQNFSAVASQYFYKTFLFKSRANNLKLNDLQQSLKTPAKIIKLTAMLTDEMLK
jgi:serine/threonine protein phosphatase 1